MTAQDQGVRAQDLARSLSVAWKNIAAYPPGHPKLTASLADAHEKVSELSALAGSLTFGVTRDSLLLSEEKIDSAHAQKFAEALYRRDVGTITFENGVTPSELEALFRLLSADPRKAPRPLWDELADGGIERVRLTPVDFSGIRTTEDLEETPPPPEHETMLEEILRALMAGHKLSAGATDSRITEAFGGEGTTALIAKILEEIPLAEGARGGEGGAAAQTGPRGTVVSAGVADLIVERVRDHMTRPPGRHRQITIHQIVELMKNLPGEVRARVLQTAVRVLATDPTAKEELRTLAMELAPDEMLRALRQVEAERQTLSPHALTLLQSLIASSSASTMEIATADDPSVKELASTLGTLFGDEDIDRYNPESHVELMKTASVNLPVMTTGPADRALELGQERLSTIEEEQLGSRVRYLLYETLPHRASEAGLEAAFGRLETYFLELLATMNLAEAIELAQRVTAFSKEPYPPHLRGAAAASLERMGAGDAARVLVDWLHMAMDEMVPRIREIIDLLGSSATRSFLYALAEEQDKGRRRKLFDFLVGLGPIIVPDAVALLSDSRWYVVRNMIALLRTTGDRRSLNDIRRCTAHPDLRVRLEAIKTLLAFEGALTRELLEKALNDPDPKLAETAVILCGSYGIAEAEGPMVKMLYRKDWFGRRKQVRLKVIRALGELGKPQTLASLEPLFRDRWWFPRASREERRAFYAALELYPAAARRPWIETGLSSRDPEIRRISETMAGTRPARQEEGA